MFAKIGKIALKDIANVDFNSALGFFALFERFGVDESSREVLYYHLLRELPGVISSKSEITFEWLEYFYFRPGPQTFQELKREIADNATLFNFSQDGTPIVRILAFQLQLLIDTYKTGEVHLSLISHALNLADLRGLDLQSFSKIYFELTNRNYFSTTFVNRYTTLIADLMSEKKMLGEEMLEKSENPTELEHFTQNREKELLLLDVMWAFSANSYRQYKTTKSKKLADEYLAVFQTFRQNVLKNIHFETSQDYAKLRQIVYIASVFVAPGIRKIQSECRLMPIKPTVLESIILGDAQVDPKEPLIISDDNWYNIINSDNPKLEPTQLLELQRNQFEKEKLDEISFEEAVKLKLRVAQIAKIIVFQVPNRQIIRKTPENCPNNGKKNTVFS